MPMVRGKNGTPIYVYDPNPFGKKTIVFIHGWPLNHQMFEYQFSALPDYRCVALDLRGFGQSAAPSAAYDYDTYVDDLAAVVKQLGLKQFILAGFSMGGAIVLHYMKKHRGAGVKKLIFMSAAAPCFTKQEGFPYGLDKSAVSSLIAQGIQNRPAMLENFNKLFFTGETQDEAFKNWCTYLSYQASGIGTMESLYTLQNADLRDDTRYVQVPTAIFHGKLDQVCLFELGEQLQKMIPQAELYPFEKSGHCIFHDELEKFNHEFTMFIEK